LSFGGGIWGGRMLFYKVVEEIGKVALGIYVTGMTLSTLKGIPRMGPYFAACCSRDNALRKP